ncbi:hypothetical protein [Caballeronia sordidicola]|uniref:hypothetical protein n=1 Tax=Caballeronia sordidicola TaxID=196367 RepID=UPI00094DC33B|nr:hypothetical protein [Caballeronia sordidicola]
MAANPSFRIKLLPGAGDGELFAPECQATVCAFFQQLRDAGVIAHPVAFTMDCAGASGCLVGEFVLPFAQVAGPAIGVAVAAWFQGRIGPQAALESGQYRDRSRDHAGARTVVGSGERSARSTLDTRERPWLKKH